MKIIPFIKWHIKKITFDMVAWMVFCFCMSAWANTKEETYFHIASALFLYGFVKITWFLVKESYKTFEREQQDLLNTIKNSDKR